MIRRLSAAAVLLLAAVPFAASAQQGPGGGPMGGLRQMGPFTLAQMQERADVRFTTLDTDHDGVLSAAEASPPPTPGSMMSAGRGVERADTNHDGKVTLEEYHAMTAALFARMDADHDGTVTPDELQALRGIMRPGGRQGGGQGGNMGDMQMPQSGGMPAPEGN